MLINDYSSADLELLLGGGGGGGVFLFCFYNLNFKKKFKNIKKFLKIT
jgi:hypothetical protein